MILGLPEEILSEVLGYLSFHDILTISTTCSDFRRICSPYFRAYSLILPNPDLELCYETWNSWECSKITLVCSSTTRVLDILSLNLLSFAETVFLDSLFEDWFDPLISVLNLNTRLHIKNSSFPIQKLENIRTNFALSDCRLQLPPAERPSKYHPPQQLIPNVYCTRNGSKRSAVVMSNCRAGPEKLNDESVSVLICFQHLACYSAITKIYLDRSSVTSETLTVIQKKCVNLTELSLKGCSGLTKVGAIIGGMVNLRRLCLAGLTQLKSIHGLGNLILLKDLDLSGCRSLDSINPIQDIITRLRYLDLSHLSVSSLEVLTVFRLTALQTLVLSGSFAVTSDVVSRIIAPNLKSLELVTCMAVNEVALATITLQSKHLRYLNLGWVKSAPGFFPNAGLILSSLKALSLFHTNITDNHLSALASYSPNSLQSLSIDFCRAVTDVGVSSVCTIGSITRLDLDHLDHLTDTSLRHISIGLPRMEHLSLMGCKGITAVGLGFLESTRRLRVINLHRCPELTNVSVERLKECIPGLRDVQYNPRYHGIIGTTG